MKTLISILTFCLLVTPTLKAQTVSNPTNLMVLHTEYVDGITYLQWETQREINTSFFIIEKSTDGQNFEFVAQKNAGGSTNQTAKYQWEDYNNIDSSCYYRVILVTMEGMRITAISCPITALTAKNSK